AAASVPNAKGQSTVGVRKSTVWTRARSAVRRYTPASSAVSKPMRTLGSVCFGSLASTESRILGLNLAAQPAAFTIAVRRVRSSIESHYMLRLRGIPIECGADVQVWQVGVSNVRRHQRADVCASRKFAGTIFITRNS